jgi:hypothetical protein
MKKAQKKAWKNLFWRWILPLYIAWQVGYNMSDQSYLSKYSRQSEEFKRAVVCYKESRNFDNEMLTFEIQCHFDALRKYLEMKDYAKKLERKLKRNGL